MNTNNKKNIVIKIGTTSIIKNDKVDITLLKSLAELIIENKNQFNFVIVTSGAVGLGATKLNYKSRPKSLKRLQVASAVGQIELINQYEKIFKDKKMNIAQVLITKNLIDDREQFVNTTQALNELLSQGIIPVINENDVVATEEIRFGDNDKLAAMVSNLISADLMIILTNQAGFFDKNPDKHDNAKLIKKCNISDININQFNIDEKSDLGTGGFKTKLQAVEMVYKNDIDTIIASGFEKDVLQRIFSGEDVGTFFKSET